MNSLTLASLTERLELGERLWAEKDRMFEPQDLPGRYGQVIEALDHVLRAAACESVVAGGWAVWRHGYFARMTHDVDIVLPADAVEECLRIAAVSGFEVLRQPPGRWPKLLHKQTGVQVDILPEGERPGTSANPAPTVIPHPSRLGAERGRLGYIPLAGLVELKIAAGRARDDFDIVELLRVNPEQVDALRERLRSVHPACPEW